jgi:DNA-binding transcriptional regulator YdaS (Cro superfamily)
MGGSAAFRRALDISPRTLSQWRSTGVPDTRWGDVSRATDGAVSADELALERAAALADAA